MNATSAAGGWYAVDSSGRDLSTGLAPRGPGAPTADAALRGAPVVTWPLAVVAADGRQLGIGEVLGPGGDRVERLLAGIVTPRARPEGSRLVELVRDTPAGHLNLPVAMVTRRAGAGVAAEVDPGWVRSVEERRSASRSVLLDGGRADQLEAALHVAMLLGTERLPALEEGGDIRAASGSQLWLLGGAVAGALAGDDTFASWAALLGCGIWPLGPVDGRLVVGERSGHALGGMRPKA